MKITSFAIGFVNTIMLPTVAVAYFVGNLLSVPWRILQKGRCGNALMDSWGCICFYPVSSAGRQ
jgi:hypothetical protein